MKSRTNEEWVRELQGQGQEQDSAIADLRVFLLRAALYSLYRNRSQFANLDRASLEHLAQDTAQEALLAILSHLHGFRSESKFTTWAYKFSVNYALVAARRAHWKNVSLDALLESGLPSSIEDDHMASDPSRAVMQREAWDEIRDIIDHHLTERQRQALQAIVFDDMPLDVVVENWGSNRNAAYKLLHDARRKLKSELLARGFHVQDLMDLFGGRGKISPLNVTNGRET